MLRTACYVVTAVRGLQTGGAVTCVYTSGHQGRPRPGQHIPHCLSRPRYHHQPLWAALHFLIAHGLFSYLKWVIVLPFQAIRCYLLHKVPYWARASCGCKGKPHTWQVMARPTSGSDLECSSMTILGGGEVSSVISALWLCFAGINHCGRALFFYSPWDEARGEHHLSRFCHYLAGLGGWSCLILPLWERLLIYGSLPGLMYYAVRAGSTRVSHTAPAALHIHKYCPTL